MNELNVNEIIEVVGGVVGDTPTPVYNPYDTAAYRAYLKRVFEKLSERG